MKNRESEIILYTKFTNLIHYSFNLLNKYPKSEKFNIVNDIKLSLYTCLRNIFVAWKSRNNNKKLELLNIVDIDLDMLKVYIKLSYELRYISSNNYKTWTSHIVEISRILGGWIKKCLKG